MSVVFDTQVTGADPVFNMAASRLKGSVVILVSDINPLLLAACLVSAFLQHFRGILMPFSITILLLPVQALFQNASCFLLLAPVC
jgi:hypothetical protein